MMVFCVHFLFIRDGKVIEMPPRTVKDLNDAGVIITLGGKPKGEQIKMNWEPVTECTTWEGTTDLSSSVMAMAHVVNGQPNVEREECQVYKESYREAMK